MQLTYVDPQGKKTTGAPADSQNIPVVNINTPLVTKKPSAAGQNLTAQKTASNISGNQSSASVVNQPKPSSTPFLKAEEFRQFIELEVLKIIKALAEKGKTPEEKLQAMAKLTLDLIKPGMNLEELYSNAVKLDDQYLELAPVVFHIMKEYEEKYEKKALQQVSQLIKAKQFDEAQNLVKKVLKFKIGNQ